MVSVDKVYELCRDIVRKSQSGGYFDETVFNRYADMAQRAYFNDKYKANESSQENDDSLQSLDVKPKILACTNGEAKYPSDYWHLQYILLPNKVNGKTINVETAQPAEASMRLASEFIAPDSQNPIAVLKDSFIEVYPTTITGIEMAYLREPTKPFWNYTVSSNRKVFAGAGGSGTNPNPSEANYLNTSGVNVSKDTITVNNHGFHTSQPVLYSNNSGTDIGGLTDGTDYFVIVVDSNTIKLANSVSSANAGTALDLTTVPTPAESQILTTNAPDHSTDFEIPEYDITNIVSRILTLMGISVREFNFSQITASGTTN